LIILINKKTLPEVIVIIRGGGSADDLSTFNDEPLVRAVAGSRIPTLVGVGHETDQSLADMVADVRAATPSNAAQILVP
jgi:exodeoxyribonuclease VII large subunit